MVFLFCPSWTSLRRPREKSKLNDHNNDNKKSIPTYCFVKRCDCPLLQSCWDQDWHRVLRLLQQNETTPRRFRTMKYYCDRDTGEGSTGLYHDAHDPLFPHSYCKSRETARTALHFCTMPSAHAPVAVLLAVLRANPHAVSLSDSHQHAGTPLHFLCGSIHRDNAAVVREFVAAATNQVIHSRNSEYLFRTTDCYYTPLVTACRKAAAAETLQALVEARHDSLWIAPWIGSERVCPHSRIYHSPLLTLWQHESMNSLLQPMTTTTVQKLKQITQVMLPVENGRVDTTCCHVPQLGCDDHGIDLNAARAWMKLVVLIRAHFCSSVTYTVACLYYPIPTLLELVCRLFPQEIRQYGRENNNDNGSTTSFSCLPLHAALRYHGRWRFEWAKTIAVLQAAWPASLTIVDPETKLYPGVLAASQNAMLETIYSMLRASPEVLQQQRCGKTNTDNTVAQL